MSADFTPGPWQYAHRRGPNLMWNTEVFCAAGETIATLSWYPMPTTSDGVTSSYREANARLIAAAPTMYELLMQLAGNIERLDHGSYVLESSEGFDAQFFIDQMCAALAKATGAAS